MVKRRKARISFKNQMLKKPNRDGKDFSSLHVRKEPRVVEMEHEAGENR